MTDQEIRLACLDRALNTVEGGDTQSVISKAEQFYSFVVERTVFPGSMIVLKG